jgi:hypothetical protein
MGSWSLPDRTCRVHLSVQIAAQRFRNGASGGSPVILRAANLNRRLRLAQARNVDVGVVLAGLSPCQISISHSVVNLQIPE